MSEEAKSLRMFASAVRKAVTNDVNIPISPLAIEMDSAADLIESQQATISKLENALNQSEGKVCISRELAEYAKETKARAVEVDYLQPLRCGKTYRRKMIEDISQALKATPEVKRQ